MSTALTVLVLLVLLFCLAVVRPAQRQRRQRMQMLAGLRPGDYVITVGGLYGTIADIRGGDILLQVTQNTYLRFTRNSVATVVRHGLNPQQQPAPARSTPPAPEPAPPAGHPPQGMHSPTPAPARVSWTGEARTHTADPAEAVRKLERLEQELRAAVRGQDHVHRSIARHLLRHATGVSGSRRKPVMVALFAGPTGTGKTETAKALARLLGRPLLVYDMTRYSQEHTVAALVGAPPGYVGSDRPGRLAADIQARPNALVLMDEIEKAHPRVFDVLLHAFDEGAVRDLSRNITADTSDTIWILTTNLLAREAGEQHTEDPNETRRMLAATGFLSPELVNRIDLALLFRPLSRETLAEIAADCIAEHCRTAASRQGLPAESVEIDRAVVPIVLAHCDPAFGARDLRRTVEALVGDAIAQAYLEVTRSGARPKRLRVLAQDGKVAALYS